MKNIFALSVLLLLSYSTRACLNEFRVTLTGGYIDLEGEVDPVSTPSGRNFMAEKPKNLRRLQKLDSLYLAQHRVEYYSDYGVVLVYLGRYEEAKAVFLAIEARQPGRYATAANLGTVYELLGHNEKALHWIQQAVRINPASHHGSEWIHVNILKAKIQGDQAINSQFLLGTDFGSAATPVATESLANVTKLRNALYFQLSERMGFIKPKDKIMGQLLFDLGNSYALTSDVESALEVYQVAKQYGYESSTLTNRRTYFTWLKHKDDLMGLLVLATALGTITFGMVKLVKRRRSRRIFS